MHCIFDRRIRLVAVPGPLSHDLYDPSYPYYLGPTDDLENAARHPR